MSTKDEVVDILRAITKSVLCAVEVSDYSFDLVNEMVDVHDGSDVQKRNTGGKTLTATIKWLESQGGII